MAAGLCIEHPITRIFWFFQTTCADFFLEAHPAKLLPREPLFLRGCQPDNGEHHLDTRADGIRPGEMLDLLGKHNLNSALRSTPPMAIGDLDLVRERVFVELTKFGCRDINNGY